MVTNSSQKDSQLKKSATQIHKILFQEIETKALEWSGCTSFGEFSIALTKIGVLFGKTREGTALKLIDTIWELLELLLTKSKKTNNPEDLRLAGRLKGLNKTYKEFFIKQSYEKNYKSELEEN